MNRKGQLMGLAIIIALIILIVGFASLNILRPEIETARGTSGLDCTNSTGISDGTKVACLATGATMPYVMWAILSLVGGLTITRFLK